MQKIYRPTWADIDLDAIRNNMKQIQSRIPDHTGVMAVVKANGYGHGAVEVARTALASGADWLGVALLEEALALREAGIEAPILVFGWVAPEDVAVAADAEVTLTCFQKDWLNAVNQLHLHRPVNIHMKWDTGMGRVGIRTVQELTQLVSILKNSPNIHLTGVYTHFSTADDQDLDHFNEQNQCFKELKTAFEQTWPYPVVYHTGNSAASSRFPELMHDLIRFGIAMYGLYPSSVTRSEHPITLKPAFSLHSRLIHVKQVDQGTPISYGATYKTKGTEWIGTIPIGYADGWIRKLQGMDVLVDGKRMPIVGRICMDQTMIQLDRSYAPGTLVTLIGRQGEEEIEVDEIADWLETINYEIPCTISERVPRFLCEPSR